MHAPVLFEEIQGTTGSIGVITLNRPEALNALSPEMIVEIDKQLTFCANKNAIKIVIIRSNSSKAFCAGGDIRKLYENAKNKNPNVLNFFRDEYRLNWRIANYPKPYIALLDGITMGGGAGISIHGSYRIGTENLVFAMPETGIGFFPDIGGSYFLPRCHGKLGYYLGLTGARIKAHEALYAGLIDYVINSEQLYSLIEELLSIAGEKDLKYAISHCIGQFKQSQKIPKIAAQQENIDFCFTAHTMPNVMEHLRSIDNEWGHKTIEILQTKSPTSLAVTLEQLHAGANLSLDKCLQMEFTMVQHFLNSHDFYEGIRAMVIDKDKNPRWKPSKLEDVTGKMVAEYFKEKEMLVV